MSSIALALAGRKILKDWLGNGAVPVSIELAQARANVCRTCPNNYKGSWLWNIGVSVAIASQMKLRRSMDIKLEGDDELAICDKCGCKLQLKVHVPIEHIYSHTSEEQLSKYPSFCWQSVEINNLKSKTK